MKNFLGPVVCVAALVAFGPAPAYAAQATTTAKPVNKSIDSRIDQRLKADPTLKKYNIHVSVDSGVATLTGTVPTEADRAKAADIAKVDGITRVDNQIVVDVNAGTAGTAGTLKNDTKEGAEKTKEGAAKVYDKTKEGTKGAYGKTKSGAEKVGEKTKEGGEKAIDATKKGASKTGEVVADSWITTRIKGDMVNEDTLHDSDVHVETNNHIVTLSGTVMSQAGRARAVEIAKGTKGVDRVIDKITIGPKK
jgi:hyperosmotically inducible periplasmic protein